MWVAVARVSDLELEIPRLVRVAQRDVALVRTEGGVFAIDNTCPHAGGSLAEGLVQGETMRRLIESGRELERLRDRIVPGAVTPLA